MLLKSNVVVDVMPDDGSASVVHAVMKCGKSVGIFCTAFACVVFVEMKNVISSFLPKPVDNLVKSS